MADRREHAASLWRPTPRLQQHQTDRTKQLVSEGEEGREERGLVRKLGLWDVILLGIGASIGAGIFVITGTVAHDAGPGVVVSFAIAGLVCFLNALCYAELSSRFPAIVGGAYLYAHSTFNELIAFIVFCHLMLDYHIGAASIARSLASYLASLFITFPAVNSWWPAWMGPGGQELLGGWLSINILAPVLLIGISSVLCLGVRESATMNGVMTATKVCIILLVVAAGSWKIEPTNWIPFAPNGLTAIITGSTVVFFAYIGFDAVANSAEESKRPERDLPIGILVSLLVCAVLYIAVCLVITGMVPYQLLGGDAPLSMAFSAKGLVFISVLIDIGAIAGLTTTVLIGLYVQSRLYLGLGRDGLLPSIFANIHPKYHTPLWGQIWVGLVAGVLSLFIDVSHLSHILSVGALTGYSVVCACVIVLRLPLEQQAGDELHTLISRKRSKAVLGIILVACFSFITGLFFRAKLHPIFSAVGILLAAFSATPVYLHQGYSSPPGFSCPGIPTVPLLSIVFNMILFAQLHWEAWVRFVVLSFLAVLFYFLYGQHHANRATSTSRSEPFYEKAHSLDNEESFQGS
ncbi:hypothetical protein O6H91_20G033100 [Diphasiastrum complanatum]|uniref:Uncharacterized protein n=1 Tax=Diphasiastrum complanatum TaxID=34168 RepID=A0ACC2APD2_DIPCM|nr:hypothetical protein O6H91_20G033100 [Diphasiastrum complanatum]